MVLVCNRLSNTNCKIVILYSEEKKEEETTGQEDNTHDHGPRRKERSSYATSRRSRTIMEKLLWTNKKSIR